MDDVTYWFLQWMKYKADKSRRVNIKKTNPVRLYSYCHNQLFLTGKKEQFLNNNYCIFEMYLRHRILTVEEQNALVIY